MYWTARGTSIPDPVWLAEPMKELLKLGFPGDLLITGRDHLVIQTLHGED